MVSELPPSSYLARPLTNLARYAVYCRRRRWLKAAADGLMRSIRYALHPLSDN